MKLRVASLALVSCLVPGAALAQARVASCVGVEVSSGSTTISRSDSTTISSVPSFSATKILDLAFTVLFPARIHGDHLVELRVFTPDGQLYRSLAVPVASRGRGNLTRSVNGYGRPLPQQPLARVARGKGTYAAALTTFPVAGTDIVSSGLYGRWRVEAYLDGAEQRCAQAATFTLNP
jgi:hypothetical protein